MASPTQMCPQQRLQVVPLFWTIVCYSAKFYIVELNVSLLGSPFLSSKKNGQILSRPTSPEQVCHYHPLDFSPTSTSRFLRVQPYKPPSAYRPISLLCVPFKILERVIFSRITPYVEKCLPDLQAGFQAGRSTIDQVLQLYSTTEDGFQLKKKTAVALVDLTAAYDTVWHQGLRLKLLRAIPDKHLVRFIMETLSNICPSNKRRTRKSRGA